MNLFTNDYCLPHFEHYSKSRFEEVVVLTADRTHLQYLNWSLAPRLVDYPNTAAVTLGIGLEVHNL